MDRDTPANPDANPKPKHPSPPVGKVRAAARLLLAMGCQPVRVRAGTKAPCDDGWQHLRLTEADIDGYFTDGYQLGVQDGEPSGWRVDVDLDCQEAVDLAEKYLPSTGCVTGRPSRPRSHWWYIAVGAKNKPFRDPVTGEMIVELRSTGQQTVVGPSIHPDDQEPYDMLEGEPAVVDAADLAARVAALHEAVVLAKYGKLPASFQRGPFLAEPSVAPAHRRITPPDDSKTQHRAQRYLAKMPAAISGQGGHGKTYAAAVCVVHGFGLEPQAAFDLLKTEYNPRCQPPWSDKELWHKVNDAVDKPHVRPYGWLRDQGGPPPAPRNATAQQASSGTSQSEGCPATGPDEEPAPADSSSFSPEPHRTDLGNAERFADMHGESLRYSHHREGWYVWWKGRWKLDDAGTPQFLAGETAHDMFRRACEMESLEARESAVKWAFRSQARPRIVAMVSQAQSIPRLVVSPSQFDVNPWLFNVLNGTVDLRTGVLRPHDRRDLLSRQSPVAFDPSAECPAFTGFLNQMLERDTARIRYLQRTLGMCLSADISEQVLTMLFGDGSNGKSIIQNLQMLVMGDYCGLAPESLLEATGRQEHPTELAGLCGLRLVFASETEKHRKLRVSAVKRLTGDKRIKARFMNQDFFEFDRTHKTVMVTNHLPPIDEQDYGTWRRIKVIPFRVVIPDSEADKHLEQKLAVEAPGIMAWLVRGCLEWQAEGLPPCAAVEEASSAYRKAEDSAARFVADCFEVDPNRPRDKSKLATPWSVVASMGIEWALEHGRKPMTDLGDRLTKLGFPSGQKWFKGYESVKARFGLSPKGGLPPVAKNGQHLTA